MDTQVLPLLATNLTWPEPGPGAQRPGDALERLGRAWAGHPTPAETCLCPEPLWVMRSDAAILPLSCQPAGHQAAASAGGPATPWMGEPRPASASGAHVGAGGGNMVAVPTGGGTRPPSSLSASCCAGGWGEPAGKGCPGAGWSWLAEGASLLLWARDKLKSPQTLAS